MFSSIQPFAFFSRILFLSGLISFTACQKEYSYEVPTDPDNPIPPGAAAAFSFVPSGNNCSDATLQGTLQKGKPIAGAQITVSVTVTKAGKWIMTTMPVNGFSFAGAGEFSATGVQSITLFGTGTPTNAGVTQIPLKAGTEICNVSITVSDGDVATTGDYYYKATIGRVDYVQYATYDNGFIPGSGGGGVDEVVFNASIVYEDDPAPAGTTSFGVEKGIMYNYLAASDADFKAFFPVGDVAYAPPGPEVNEGITISWSDPQGKFWTTDAGTGDQTGSTFKIVSVTDSYDVLGRYYIEVKMQFKCNLYNYDTGEKKILTNGEMVGLFGKF